MELEYKLLKQAIKIKPDVMIGGPSTAHISKLVNAKSIAFMDSEHAFRIHLMTIPFVDFILSPDCYKEDYGTKHIKYPGYHELAYLHPNRFTPNPDVLDYLKVDNEDKIIILRFIAWKAVHDIGQTGLNFDQKKRLVSTLENYGKVFITSESKLPKEFEDYRLTIPIHRMHDLMYYADFYMGDSQTMATESAVLGTPSIRCNSFAGEHDMSNFIELQKKYGLLYSTPNPKDAIKKAKEWMKDPRLKEKWNKKRQRLLTDKIDVTEFMVNAILKEGKK